MSRLFINNELSDFDGDVKFYKTVIEPSDLSKRGVRISNSFTMKNTNNNRRLLGYPDQLNSSSTSFEEYPVYVYEDSNGIVSSGSVIIKRFDEKRGTTIQLSEGVSFWENAESRQLNTFPLHEFDFLFNNTNMNNRKAKGDNIFLTALHDSVGNKSNTALTNYSYTRPFYVVKNVIDKACDSLGYSVEYGDVLENTKLNNVGIASNTSDFFVSDYKIRFSNISFLGAISGGSVVFNTGSNVTQSNGVFTNTSQKTSFSFKGVVSCLEDSQLRFIFPDRTEVLNLHKGTNYYSFKTSESEIGQTMSVSSTARISLDDCYVYSVVSEADIFDVSGNISIEGWMVLSDYNLPNWSLKQLIKVVSKQFFLDFEEDVTGRVVRVSTIGNSLNTNNSIDLSDRIDFDKKWKSGKVYGKSNFVGYNNDEDVNEDKGRFYFDGLNTNGVPLKPFISIDEVSASNEVAVSGNRIVQYSIYNTLENKRQAVSHRIVYFNNTGSFGYNATFNEISFSRLFSENYSSFVTNTLRERQSTLMVKLKYSEYVGINKNPLIYIRELSGLFLVTKIDGFQSGKLTKIQVLKYG